MPDGQQYPSRMLPPFVNLLALFRKLVSTCVSRMGSTFTCTSSGGKSFEELQRRPDKQAMRLIDVIEQPVHTLPLKGEREVTRLDARQFQHIAHQLQQQFGIGVDNVHKFLPLFV